MTLYTFQGLAAFAHVGVDLNSFIWDPSFNAKKQLL